MEQAEIIKVTQESLPALRLIGKRYTDADRHPELGSYAHKWGEWMENGWFGALAALPAADGAETGYIGLMGVAPPDTFEYWIGVFAPAGTPAPEGFVFADLPAAEVGVCWIRGTEPGIYWMHEYCAAELLGEGMEVPGSGDSARWFAFERYNHPRFTEPDAAGDVILDYGIYLA
jgi:hypothetical protein